MIERLLIGLGAVALVWLVLVSPALYALWYFWRHGGPPSPGIGPG